MTVDSTQSVFTYAGNGVTVDFNFNNTLYEDASLVVLEVVDSIDSSGLSTLLVLDTDYTVAIASDNESAVITLTTATASLTKLVIARDQKLTQPDSYQNGGPFPAKSHEKALDREITAAQSVKQGNDRSPRLDNSFPVSPTLNTSENPDADFLKLNRATGEWMLSVLGTITTGTIVDGAVTTPKLSNNAVTVAKMEQLSAYAVFSNNTGSTSDPQKVAIDNVKVKREGTTTPRDFKDRFAVDVRDFGAVADGASTGGVNPGTDNTTFFQAAIDYIATFTPTTSRQNERPYLFIPGGVFYCSGTLNVGFKDLVLRGEGKNNSTIYFDGAGALFELGTWDANPSDVFVDTAQGFQMHGISIVNEDGVWFNTPVTRAGYGIRDNGNGGIVLKDVAINGFICGYLGSYGTDFNVFDEACNFSFNDVGVYIGPGGQQFKMSTGEIAWCYEGLVIDRAKNWTFDVVSFNSNRTNHVVLEANSTNTTRWGVTTNKDTGLQMRSTFNQCWFETFAGGLGVVAEKWITTKGTSATTNYKDISIIEPIIVAGGSAPTANSAFLDEGTIGFLNVTIEGVVASGSSLSYIVFGTNNAVTIRNYRTQDGSTPIPLWEIPSLNSYREYYDNTGSQQTQLSGGIRTRIEYNDLADGRPQRIEYRNNAKVAWAFKSGGTWFTRAGFDVQNSRLYLGDPDVATDFSMTRSSSQPTSGTFADGDLVWNTNPGSPGATGPTVLGWQRLGDGSTHGAGTWFQLEVSGTLSV